MASDGFLKLALLRLLSKESALTFFLLSSCELILLGTLLTFYLLTSCELVLLGSPLHLEPDFSLRSFRPKFDYTPQNCCFFCALVGEIFFGDGDEILSCFIF